MMTEQEQEQRSALLDAYRACRDNCGTMTLDDIVDRLMQAVAPLIEEARNDEREGIACSLLAQGRISLSGEILAGLTRPVNQARHDAALNAWRKAHPTGDVEALNPSETQSAAVSKITPSDPFLSFEKWATNGGGDPIDHVFNIAGPQLMNRYLSSTTQLCWLAHTAGLEAKSPADVRASFERWTVNGGNPEMHVFSLTRCSDVDRYLETTTELCWLAYNAGIAEAASLVLDADSALS